MLTEKQLKQLEPNCSILSTVRQEDDEQAWLMARTHGIGGSDVGAICGVNNWSSAKQIYFRKTGMYQDETQPSAAAQERMHFGHVLEPVVADEFVAHNPEYTCVEADCTFKNNTDTYLLANVDRFVCDADGNIVGILECKTANEAMNDEWNAGEVPISYYYQVQHYMHVTGIHRAWIACLVGGNKFYIYDLFYDDYLYSMEILPKLSAFWFENVLKLQEPAPMSADSDFYDQLFKPSNVVGEKVDLVDTKYDEIGDQILALKVEIKERQNKVNELQAIIKSALGNNFRGYSSSYEFTWSPRTRTGVDSNKLRTEFPDVYDACLKTTEYRQMGIKRVATDE